MKKEIYNFHISRIEVIRNCLHDLQTHGWKIDRISLNNKTQMTTLIFIKKGE